MQYSDTVIAAAIMRHYKKYVRETTSPSFLRFYHQVDSEEVFRTAKILDSLRNFRYTFEENELLQSELDKMHFTFEEMVEGLFEEMESQ